MAGRNELRAWVMLGIFLQLGALIFGGFATYFRPSMAYLKEGEPVENHAFPLMATGTLILSFGMWLCSYVVEGSTVEHAWEVLDSSKGVAKPFRIIWLQQGGSVTDQQFDSYAIIGEKPLDKVLTSRLSSAVDGRSGTSSAQSSTSLSQRAQTQHHKPCEAAKSKETGPASSIQVLTTIATAISVGGFVIQFTGLRAMHFSASIAQLIVTGIMVLVRAWVRRGLTTKPSAYKIPQGFEMDWLATRLAAEPERLWQERHNKAKASFKNGGRKQGTGKAQANASKAVVTPREHYQGNCNCGIFDASCWHWTILTGRGTESFKLLPYRPSIGKSNSHRAVKVRERIARADRWLSSSSEAAVALSAAIEVVMNTLFAEESQMDPSMFWTVQGMAPENSSITAQKKGSVVKEDDNGEIHLALDRVDGQWKSNATEIDALLSLWLFSIHSKGNEQQSSAAANNEANVPKDWLRFGGNALRTTAVHLLGQVKADSNYFRNLRWFLDDGFHSLRIVEPAINVPNATANAIAGQLITVPAQFVLGFRSAQGEDNSPLTGSRTYKVQPVELLTSSPEEASGSMIPSNDTLNGQDSFQQSVVGIGTVNVAPIERHLVRDLFSAFLWAVSRKAPQISGKTTIKVDTLGTGGGAKALPWESFRFNNSVLTELTREIVAAAGEWLGDDQEVYLNLIPPLSENGKLPSTLVVVDHLRELAHPHESNGSWEEATQIYLTLLDCAKTFSAGDPVRRQAAVVSFEFSHTLSEFRRLKEEFDVDTEFINELRGLESRLLDALVALEEPGDGLISSLTRLYRLQCRPFSEIEGRLYSMSPCPMSDEQAENENGDTTSPIIPDWISRVCMDPTLYLAICDADHTGNAYQKAMDKYRDSTSDMDLQWTTDCTGWSIFHYATVQATSSSSLGKLVALLRLYSLKTSGSASRRFPVDLAGKSPLHYANCKEAARELTMRSGALMRAVSRDGTTALLAAGQSGKEEVFEFLVDAGVEPKLASASGETALHWAVYHGFYRAVEKLKRKGADLKARDNNGRTPLHWTRASAVLTSELVTLLELQDDELDSRDLQGNSVLHIGAISGAVSQVALSDLRRVDPKLRFSLNSLEQTPLDCAAAHGHAKATGFLINNQMSDIERLRKNLTKPLQQAVQNGHEEVVEVLLSWSARMDWSDLPGDGHKDITGVSSTGLEYEDVGPVSCAARADNKSMIRLLLNHNPLQKDLDAAFLIALRMGNEKAVLLLWDHVQSFRTSPRSHPQLVANACSLGLQEVVRRLLDTGVDINLIGEHHELDGFKPTHGPCSLYHAAREGHEKVVELLLTRGVDVNLEDHVGRTALWHACAKKHINIVKILLEHEAKLGTPAKNQAESSFEYLPSLEGDIIKLLEEHSIQHESFSAIGKFVDLSWLAPTPDDPAPAKT
ncbi:ankyrin [Ascobolus immersus RN42]|uniref:Ankyrin n=1 Tax=Ascobolus immersus RN42 TaxID=1160509 RepID=A0A3N4IHE3_ASCIM|nr:ankyrin [Ascobolus immersus RN42]